MAQERFLILGASSFYGRNFAEYVEARGDIAVRCKRYDFLDGFRLKSLRDYYMVNFASKSLVAESWGAPEEWAEANLTEFSVMLSALGGEGFKKFIHVSTPESYGHTPDWVDETYSAWKPSTPYGVSRAAADMMLMAYHRAYGFPAIITRTANIYGLGQGANRIIPTAFKAKADGRKLDLHGGGDTVRSFINVRDACAATYLIAKQGNAGQTYHISTRDTVSIKRLCDIIGVETGSQEDRLGKDKAYLLNSNKLRALGWTDTITLEKGLEEYGQMHRHSRALP